MRNVEGKNPVIELIKEGKEVEKIYLQKGLRGDKIKLILEMAEENNIYLEWLPKFKIDEKAVTDNHQGVIALTSEIETYDLYEIIDSLENKDDPLILILDHIQDPHNFGAIIRTAHAAGVDAIIYPKDRACSITATVDKVSAGAIEHVNLVEVVNINRAIDVLKEKYYWIVGADINGEQNYFEHDFEGKYALVLGHEGSGLARLTKEKCDFLVKIPMQNEFSSLNVSVAAGVILFEVNRQRNTI
ncbi:MAG TPA: 23S rRNA (guanosine(2251)-2'-O)-methyltransferase RlmB [Halanaerobiales bacterium]|nr:23S rRNA (guanosine(2251)-2'-O)-methyltransferase RlmB [Halanaerobiales bacterium]